MTIKDTYRATSARRWVAAKKDEDGIVRKFGNWASDLLETFMSCLTFRWSSNPDFRDIGDCVGGHSARVTLLLIRLWPESSKDAMTYALTHDLGEAYTGDWPAEFKRDYPELAAQEAKIGAEYVKSLGFTYDVTRTEIDRVKLCDRLDAYMTAQHHKPHLMQREDWQADRRRLLAMAEQLGVRARVEAAI